MQREMQMNDTESPFMYRLEIHYICIYKLFLYDTFKYNNHGLIKNAKKNNYWIFLYAVFVS